MIAFETFIKYQHLISENNIAFINDLEDAFGKDLVWSKSFDYVMTDNDLQKLYDILNKHAFNNELKQPQSITIVKDDTASYAGRHGILFEAVDLHKNIHHVSNVFVIEMRQLKMCNFFQTIGVLCHEMIHQSDAQDPLIQRALEFDYDMCQIDKNHQNVFDTHGKSFKAKMKRINEQLGLDVQVTLDQTRDIFMKRIDEQLIGKLVQKDDPILSSDNPLVKGAKKVLSRISASGYCEAEIIDNNSFIVWYE